MDKKQARNRRSRQTRVRIAFQRATRLVVIRSNSHIYAQIIAPEGDRILASASTVAPRGNSANFRLAGAGATKLVRRPTSNSSPGLTPIKV